MKHLYNKNGVGYYLCNKKTVTGPQLFEKMSKDSLDFKIFNRSWASIEKAQRKLITL